MGTVEFVSKGVTTQPGQNAGGTTIEHRQQETSGLQVYVANQEAQGSVEIGDRTLTNRVLLTCTRCRRSA